MRRWVVAALGVFVWSCESSPAVPTSTLVGDWRAVAFKWDTIELRLREDGGRVIGTACHFNSSYNALFYKSAPVTVERSGRVTFNVTKESVVHSDSHFVGDRFTGRPQDGSIVGTFAGQELPVWYFFPGGSGVCEGAKPLSSTP